MDRLLQALLTCFHDSSWLVRDAACISSSHFILGFPKESYPAIEAFYTLWCDHLGDEIWSIREDAAIALGNMVRAYGDEALERTISVAKKCLQLAKQQPAMSQQEYEAKQTENRERYRNQAFSCCSLEPKCINSSSEERPKEPWAYSDGAIYLVRELCTVAPQKAEDLLSSVVDLSILRHFPQTSILQETVWKQIPKMAQALGKNVFKRHLEQILDPLVFTLNGNNRLAKFAAVQCVQQLNQLIGPVIFQGRIQHHPDWRDAILPIIQQI